MWDQLKLWDRQIFIYLNGLGVDYQDGFWIFVTQINHWIPLYILFFVLFFLAFKLKKALYTSVFLLIAFLSTFSLTMLAKSITLRVRPNNTKDLVEIIRILQEPTNYSFPSGHASSSFVITTFVVLALRKRFKWIYAVYIWPILLSLSRIFVGVHYPSDVLVGALVGVIMAIFFYKLYQRSGKKFY